MQRDVQVQAVLEVGQGVHKIILDPEEFHDKEEMKSGSSPSADLGLQGGNPAACRVSTQKLGRWLDPSEEKSSTSYCPEGPLWRRRKMSGLSFQAVRSM